MNSLNAVRRCLYWLYPGLEVKRWVLLIALGAVLVAISILGLVGRDLVSFVYWAFASTGWAVELLSITLVLGLFGLVYGSVRAVRSIAGGISADAERRSGEILYRQRRLSQRARVVAVGGGTGLSTLLRGLKAYTSNITAIVTVMDDGGSSGRLRREMNMLPPGDIRNCLIALAEDESRVARLFSHRFANGHANLHGHSFGNLALAGLQEITGGFDRAVEELSAILNIRGRVLPATLEDVDLIAEMDDGSTVRGEHSIAEDPRRIQRIMLSEPRVSAYPKALEAVREADLIVLGPGSLYTSILPNLLVEGLAHEVERSRARVVYVANVMTQPGETDGYSVRDHLEVVGRYLDLRAIDAVLVNAEPIAEAFVARYREEGAAPVVDDLEEQPGWPCAVRTHVVDVAEMDGKQTIKHAPAKLAKAIFAMHESPLPSRGRRPSSNAH